MKELKEINIQEPAVKEMHTKRSCFRRSCTSSCGCFVFLIIIIMVLLNIYSGAGTHEVKDVPTTIPQDIEIYETQRIQTIEVSDTAPNGRAATITSYLPKFFLASTYMILGGHSPESISTYYTEATDTSKSGISRFLYLLQQPISPQTQQIKISWKNLPAEPNFIQSYYTTNLTKHGYTVSVISTTPEKNKLTFQKGAVLGTLLIHDSNLNRGTEDVLFDITLPLTY